MQRPICSTNEPKSFRSKVATVRAGSAITRARFEAPAGTCAELFEEAAAKVAPVTPAWLRNCLLHIIDMLRLPVSRSMELDQVCIIQWASTWTGHRPGTEIGQRMFAGHKFAHRDRVRRPAV